MFSIGEFSRATGLTVKTLRFYHEQGLLVPSHVEERTGYRYYAPALAETARAIAALRGLEFSVDEIREILRQAADDTDLLEALERRRAELAASIRTQRDLARVLDRYLKSERKARQAMARAAFEVEEKVLPPMRVAGIRMRGRYESCGTGFARIGRRFGRQICGAPFLLHYDAEYREDDADFETCMPVRGGQPADGITVRELPGARCISLLHQGPYDQLGRSYAKALGYVQEKGYEVVLPTREVYVKGPGMIFRGNPQNYLTEIQLTVRGDEAGAAPRAQPN